MRARFAGAREPQTLKQVDRAAEPDDLQTQRPVLASGFVLQLANYKRAEPPVSIGWQQGKVNAADLLVTPLHEQAAHGFSFQQDDLVHGILKFGFVEALLRLVL